jgi:hypothetical protein
MPATRAASAGKNTVGQKRRTCRGGEISEEPQARLTCGQENARVSLISPRKLDEKRAQPPASDGGCDGGKNAQESRTWTTRLKAVACEHPVLAGSTPTVIDIAVAAWHKVANLRLPNGRLLAVSRRSWREAFLRGSTPSATFP